MSERRPPPRPPPKPPRAPPTLRPPAKLRLPRLPAPTRGPAFRATLPLRAALRFDAERGVAVCRPLRDACLLAAVCFVPAVRFDLFAPLVLACFGPPLPACFDLALAPCFGRALP